MKIYLDAGFYRGGFLKTLLNNGIVDKDWTIYAFEPNPELNVRETIKEFPVKINLIEKAAWTDNGHMTFHIAGREDSASLSGTTGHTSPKEVTVETIDFSAFVASLPEAYIICSMDIEGAEFPVLEKMLKEGTIDKINELDVEFHHRFMEQYTHVEAQDLINRIEERGPKIRLKVELQ